MNETQWIACAAVQLTNRESPYKSVHSMTLHWRRNVREDEMRGIAVTESLKMKPGFSIDEIVVAIAHVTEPATQIGDTLFVGGEEWAKVEPAAPTGSHASAGAETGDGAAFCKAYGLNTAPASPAVAEPATEGADERLLTEYAFNSSISSAIYMHGHHLPADAWKGVACDMRDRASKFESIAKEYESRLKEAEAKLADLRKELDREMAQRDAACKDREEAEADKEQAVARERGEIVAMVPDQVKCGSLENLACGLSVDGYCEEWPVFIRALHARLTQPANRSDLPQANPSAEVPRE